MSMEITNIYSGYPAQSVPRNNAPESTKKKETGNTSATTKTGNTESTSDYLSRLQKQIPYMKLEVGTSLSMARDNKVNTLAVSPKLLEKMQNDPEKEKEYTQRLKDIENAQKFVDSYMKAKGSTTKFSHWFVDENGNYSHIAYYEHDNTFFKKLSEKSRENIQKHIDKMKEKIAEKQKEFQERLEEKRTEKEDEPIISNKTEQIKTGFSNVNDYSRYLQKKYSYMNTGMTSMQGVPTTVLVSGAFLNKCMNDPEKAKYLEENLAAIPDCAKMAVNGSLGTLTSLSYQIDANGNITCISSGTSDPDGKIARENAKRKAQEDKTAEEKAAKRRAEKKAEEERAAEKRAEKKAEARTKTDYHTVSTSDTDIKDIFAVSLDISAPTGASFDIKA